MCDGHTFAIYVTNGNLFVKKQKLRNFGVMFILLTVHFTISTFYF